MNYLIPETLDQALRLISSQRNAKLIAGGTDLSVQIADSLISPEILVDISGLEELKGIEEKNGFLSLGAATTIDELVSSSILPHCLVQGAKSIGSPQIRNIGTLGGNICNASPCGDTLTPLIALGGILVLVSSSARRKVRLEDFFIGPKMTVCADNEILTEVLIEKDYLQGRSAFRMTGKRSGQVISQVNVAIWLEAGKSREIEKIRAAVGSVAPVPLRLKRVEQALKGRAVHERLLKEVSELINEEIKPISDVRATDDYRRRVTVTLFRDALEEALQGFN